MLLLLLLLLLVINVIPSRCGLAPASCGHNNGSGPLRPLECGRVECPHCVTVTRELARHRAITLTKHCQMTLAYIPAAVHIPHSHNACVSSKRIVVVIQIVCAWHNIGKSKSGPIKL